MKPANSSSDIGTVIVQPLYSVIVHYANEIFVNGNPKRYKYPLPIVPGGPCIARILAAPPDAVTMKAGQLAFVEMTHRARDDASTKILRGFYEGATDETRRFMRGEWQNGSWATVTNAMVESVHPLDEEALLGRLGYKEELGSISTLAVAFGGLSDVNVKAGETVLVAPATGSFGSGAVHIALAMGARVMAMGRSEQSLQHLKSTTSDPGRIEVVKISGSVEEDAKALARFGPVDVYFDISPDAAAKSSHREAAIDALRIGGRISLMGGVHSDFVLPYGKIVHKELTIKGTFMSTSQQTSNLVKMVETGVLSVGERAGMRVAGKYSLEEWETAFAAAASEAGPGRSVYFVPNGVQ
ncbi:hypothetical protein K4F52_000212 [Lecanicillium sp. MT-2017a]|nr:hypothetical protein K4F52_000212 [Lecanicillium sp. MT-2017a]